MFRLCGRKKAEKIQNTPINSSVSASGKYVEKDVFSEYKALINERCLVHEKAINDMKDRQRSIDKKITATLVFVICTLVAILTSICFQI